MQEKLVNNITDTALVIEGGGTRASYSAAFIVQLLQQGIYFNYVTGISAGSSHAVNYLSRDIPRTKASFVDLMEDPLSHGMRHFLRGKGFFNAHYVYEEIARPGHALPFDFDRFQRNPAQCRIGAFDLDEGLVYFQRSDMTSRDRLLQLVRASSSLPVIMPQTEIDGHTYLDGGCAGGIPLDIAIADGYKKFFVVLTKPSTYRREPPKQSYLRAIAYYYHKYPKLIEALQERYTVYNQTLDQLKDLERDGKALIVYSEHVEGSNKNTHIESLQRNFDLGYQQSLEELPRWKKFLEID